MRKILLSSTLIYSIFITSQTAGTLDPNFANNGTYQAEGQKFFFPFHIVNKEKSGEIYTAGLARNQTDSPINAYMIKLDFYGNPITSFGNNGIIYYFFPEAKSQSAYQIEVKDDGSFYISGSYTDINDNQIGYISKHLPNGNFDMSYGINGVVKNLAGQISGDHIYSLTLNSVTGHQNLKRYVLSTGLLDSSFSNNDLPLPDVQQHFNFNPQYRQLNIQKDGKIILSGYTLDSYNNRTKTIMKLNNNGTIDTSFGNNGTYIADALVSGFDPYESITQNDGKIIFVADEPGAYMSLTRLNQNGTLDASYGNQGTFKYNYGPTEILGSSIGLQIQSDDAVLVAGSILNNNEETSLYLGRINKNGTLDFIRKDKLNWYSENFSTAIISDTYALTYGVEMDRSPLRYPTIQRIFLKQPIITIFGTATQSKDITLTTTDGTIFKTTSKLYLGQTFFRLNKESKYLWGGTNFPQGNSTMGVNEISIPETADYDINFNIKTGDYSFIKKLGTADIQKAPNNIYPNPVKDILNFSSKAKSYKIFDTSGKFILSDNGLFENINLQSIEKGTYYIQWITEDNNIINSKFLKN